MCASVRVFVRFYIELSSARQSSSWAGKAEFERSPHALCLSLSRSLPLLHLPIFRVRVSLKPCTVAPEAPKNESIAFELLSYTGIGIHMCWYTETLAWRKSLSFYYALSQLFWTAEFTGFFFCTRLRREAIGSNLNCKRNTLDSPF